MKSILISGVSGYIGSSFNKWMKKTNKSNYKIDNINLKNAEWKSTDLSEYQTILHLAAIVHSPLETTSSYYQVNRDLTIALAKKAKEDGVKHFVFFSTLSVYGLHSGNIDRHTKENPTTDYGKSKLEAERGLIKLIDANFKVTIIRPPIVYGPEAPGNFTKMVKLFNFIPIFPKVENERSMIFIDTLSEFIYLVIKYEVTGIYVPQNKEYVSTSSVFENYRRLNGKIGFLLPLLLTFRFYSTNPTLSKVFGSLTVSKEMSYIPFEYQKISFERTISSLIEGEHF
ncbi:NAD-dependent epimerase/dehydratase family protein [Exiguobacterium mexicanum]|uniref:NAD-dependent epimerase/dehydratase family protein n=1 Tax=Exiguobacterium mexicanum TaxID=340146 RepID=UPI0037BEE492